MSCFHSIIHNKWIDCCECSICGSKYKCDNCLMLSDNRKILNENKNLSLDIVKCYKCNNNILIRLCNKCGNPYCIGCF